MLRNMVETAGGRPVLGTQYVGLLAAQILAETATGTNGAGAMYNDGLVTGKRYKMVLASPGTFPGTVQENGALNGVTASVSTTDRLYEDNILVAYAPGGFDVPLVVFIGTAPAITVQLAAQTVAEGAVANFSVTATGTAPLTYQWRFNGTPISGETASTYARTTIIGDNGGQVSVVVSNGGGSVASSNALLTVIASGSGRITSSALVWNNNVPHRAAPMEAIVRSINGLTMVAAKTSLTTAQDIDGDWVCTFQDAAVAIGQWYRIDYRRTDIGTRGAIGTEFIQATA